jgi:hypothetical protein
MVEPSTFSRRLMPQSALKLFCSKGFDLNMNRTSQNGVRYMHLTVGPLLVSGEPIGQCTIQAESIALAQ